LYNKISASTSEESGKRLHRCWWTRRYISTHTVFHLIICM